MTLKFKPKEKTAPAKKPGNTVTMEQVGRMIDAKLKAFELGLVVGKRIQPRAQ